MKDAPEPLTIDRLGTASRRRFLLQSAVGVSAAFGLPLRLAAQPAPSDRLGLAVIGCGAISRAHAPQLRPLFEPVAVCEVDRLRGEQYLADFDFKASLTDDYRQLLSRADIDAVLICTPDHWHAKIAIEALHAGKDVYCEKPLTLTIEEGAQIRQAVADTGGVLQVGTQQRSSPDFQTAVALAHAGRVGVLKRVTAAIGGGPVGGPFPVDPIPSHFDWDRWVGPAPGADFRFPRCHGNFRWWYEYSGGKMTDWGAHHVDIALWAAAPNETGDVPIEPIRVVHQPDLVEGMPTSVDHYNTAATFHVRCHLANGVELDICDSAVELGFDNGILFEGSEGRYFVNRGKLTGKPVEQLADAPLPAGSLAGLRKGREVMPHLTNFYSACRDRGATISDVDSHVLHLNTCHAANIAMRLNHPVVWQPSSDSFADDRLTERWVARPKRAGYEIASRPA